MAAKKKVNKSEFVRSMPGAKASDVVAAAKKQGIKLTDRYVYVIRSSDNAKARRPGSSLPRGTGRRAGSGNAEAQLRQAIAELGLAAARRILADVESSFR